MKTRNIIGQNRVTTLASLNYFSIRYSDQLRLISLNHCRFQYKSNVDSHCQNIVRTALQYNTRKCLSVHLTGARNDHGAFNALQVISRSVLSYDSLHTQLTFLPISARAASHAPTVKENGPAALLRSRNPRRSGSIIQTLTKRLPLV